MAKTVIKEISIVLLLIIAIFLLLAIIFYDYLPTNKIVPAKVVAYEMPEEIKEDLKDVDIGKTDNIIKTYTVEADDLKVYEKSKKYDKGKENPFSISSSSMFSSSSNTTNTINTTNSNSKTSTSSTQQTNTSSSEYQGK